MALPRVQDKRNYIADVIMGHHKGSDDTLRIIFQDPRVRDAFSDGNGHSLLEKEHLYPFSSLTYVAVIQPGHASKFVKGSRPVALGKMIELKNHDDTDVRMGATIDDFPYEGRNGIFLAPYSVEEVPDGETVIDKKKNLVCMRFAPIREDYVFGMFYEWERRSMNDQASLVLYATTRKLRSMRA